MSAPVRFGLTWWGQRWIAALEALGALYANRLPRGRTYARRGAVTDLMVTPGEVTARVQGSRARPYRVRLGLPVFDDATWSAITNALASQVRHAAALLDGRMPEDIEDTLAGCGVSLFPRPGELDTACSCPDWANPCKHVAAVHYVLAQTFDADPFLLPALRGREQGALLAGLRAVRSGVAAAHDADECGGGEVALSNLSASTLWDAPGDLAAIAVHPAPAADPGALLRRLGSPPGGVPGEDAAVEALVAGAARLAWRLANGDGDEDPLLVELRARGTASAAELAAVLGLPPPEVRTRLRPLLDGGVVRRTGHARGTRYHA
jgi:uncharacterized Zn finger protein